MKYTLDSLVKAACSCVDETMLHPTQKHRIRYHHLQGYCYVIAEALWHQAGMTLFYHPMRVKHEGQSHWFLQHGGDGHIVDPTAGQFDQNVPYRLSKRAGFLTKTPSGRARKLMVEMDHWLMMFGCKTHEAYEIESLVGVRGNWITPIPGGFCKLRLILNHPFLRTAFHRVEVTSVDRTVGFYREFFGAEGMAQAGNLFEHMSNKVTISQDFLKSHGFLTK